ncbi:MAG: phytanoyl-CoA dioxygenase family protein [Planctomycetaceae bacterium]|nr:phytanoyl-CoA dioxygenase family protein [Planctomycetaceae bacterium]
MNGTDLSQFHQPVSDLFTSTASDRERAPWQLSPEQVAFFHEHGYVAGPKVLTDVQIDQLRQELTTLTEPGHPGSEFWYEYNSNESPDPSRVLFHALGAWRISPAFHDILWNAAYTTPAAQLLGGPVRFWHDQLFCKPAMHGGVVAWHQDYSYWTRTKPMAHLTCWIGLDDSTVDNGCVHYVPGSHRWDLLPITGLAGDMNAIQKVLNAEQWEQFNNHVPVELKAGECVFHHPLTIHGSFENRTPNPRRAVVINSVLDGVRSESDQPLLAGIPVIPPGQPLGGQFFPMLYNINSDQVRKAMEVHRSRPSRTP